MVESKLIKCRLRPACIFVQFPVKNVLSFLLLHPVAGPERRLVMVESKLIKCRMSQTIGGETTPFTYKPLEGIQSCTVFEVNMWADASYLCVGMPDKVVLLKYNPSLGMYCVRKVRHCG